MKGAERDGEKDREIERKSTKLEHAFDLGVNHHISLKEQAPKFKVLN